MHHFVPLSPDKAFDDRVKLEHTQAIKRWARELLRLGDEDVTTVSEFPCRDPGCPLVETVIAVFSGQRGTRTWILTRPSAAVTKLMIQQTLATPPREAT
jgi:hypothetical protein